MNCFSASASAGSSPLTRGKRQRGVLHRVFGGLIPAHAGKTTKMLSRRVTWRAHPRSRGENEPSRAIRSTAPGSSPLTRGKLAQLLEVELNQRLIPAHAGKTSVGDLSTLGYPAHPRSRGENIILKNEAGDRLGSSPLTRGKHLRGRGPQPGAGLIPAHAGKTHDRLGVCAHRGAHPRSRGENWWEHHPEQLHPGSSPLTRGKPGRDWRDGVRSGLIPAHAGKTTSARPEYAPIRAHPRSRGENTSSSQR